MYVNQDILYILHIYRDIIYGQYGSMIVIVLCPVCEGENPLGIHDPWTYCDLHLHECSYMH